MGSKELSLLINSFFTQYPDAHSVIVADREKLLVYEERETISVSFPVHSPITEESISARAIATGRKVEGDAESQGVFYYAIAHPVLIAGEVTGVVTVIFPDKKQQVDLKFLSIRLSDRWIPIAFTDVVFMEAQNRKTYITSVSGKGTHRLNLTELERILPGDIFFRCHRSYIINVNQVEEIQPDSHATLTLVMKDGSRAPVSQNYVKDVRKRFGF